MSDKKEFLFKILLCGDGAVGKTSIRENFMGKGFQGSYAKTVGADFASKKLDFDGNGVTFQIFDLAGQDVYRTARKTFYKNGKAAFLVFDLQDPESMYNLKTWIQDSIDNSDGSIQTFIALGNKADLVETRQVSNEMAIEHFQRLASETGITFVFLETSALTGMNVPEAFDLMGKRLLRKFDVDIDFTLPKGVELIKPSGTASPAPVAAPAAASGELKKVTAQMNSIIEQVNKMGERLDKLETRFNKLTAVVKKLAQQ